MIFAYCIIIANTWLVTYVFILLTEQTGVCFSQLFDSVVQSPNITDIQKARIAERLAETDKVLSEFL